MYKSVFSRFDIIERRNMGKDIKTKESIKCIKLKDAKNNHIHFIKEKTIATKDKTIEEKNESTEKINAQVQAAEDITQTAKIVSIQSMRKVKRYAKESLNIKNTHQTYKINPKSPNFAIRYHHPNSHKNTNTSNYVSYMKNHFVNKYKVKVNKTAATRSSSKTFYTTVDVIKSSYHAIKKSILSVHHIIGYGTVLILLLVLTLFIGTFAALSDNTVNAIGFVPLSEEVLLYTPIIEEYAKQYEIDEYVPLIQAIMMQESRGLGNDPMDSSCFEYNTQYPDGIKDPEYSIEIGIHFLADCLSEAAVSSISDTESIYLAIQGYDFGKEYINWAFNHFGGYSSTNAQLYADQMKSKLNLSSYGNPHYVEKVMQYIDLGFGTFRLQPNFNNHMAWGNNNPYSRNKLYGQCTWFAWGRFYELYGYSPGFTGDGWNCAKQLVNAHPEQFELSSNPQVGSIFSCIGRNHVGIVVGWDGTNITIQEGNLDGKTNTFGQAKSDWQTVTYEINQFRRICDGVIFAIRKS